MADSQHQGQRCLLMKVNMRETSNSWHIATTFCEAFDTSHYIAGNTCEKHEANPVFWLANRVGMMIPSCLLGIDLFDLAQKKIEWSGLAKFNNFYFKVPQSIASDIMSVFRGLKKHFCEGLRFVLWSQRFLQTRTLPITCISMPHKVWCAIFRLWVFGLRSSVEFGLRFMILPPVLSRLWQPRQSKHVLKTEVTVFYHMNRPLAGK